MPAVYDAFVASGRSPGQSWRLTFIIPLVMVIVTGTALLLLCPDTPTGKWADRHLQAKENLHAHGIDETIVDIPGAITDRLPSTPPDSNHEKVDLKIERKTSAAFDHEAQLSKTEMIQTAQGEIVQKPTLKEALQVARSPQTIFHILTYSCSFGSELAINAILASYYVKNFPSLGQTAASNYAAIFGFLNFVTRPLGGIVSDILYNYFGRSLWLKKMWIVVCGAVTGVLLIVIGVLDPKDQGVMFGLVAVMAVFLEAGNGANFSLVPHVHPFANGILSGLTGAGGNLGGVVFAVVFRFMDGGKGYARGFWVIGVVNLGIALGVSWIRPLPRGQVGGH